MTDIELVIKIPKEYYELVLERCKDPVLLNAFKNGVELPKGHGDLIDAKGLKAGMSCYMMDMTKSYTARYVMSVAKGLVDFQKPIIKADNEEE